MRNESVCSLFCSLWHNLLKQQDFLALCLLIGQINERDNSSLFLALWMAFLYCLKASVKWTSHSGLCWNKSTCAPCHQESYSENANLIEPKSVWGGANSLNMRSSPSAIYSLWFSVLGVRPVSQEHQFLCLVISPIASCSQISNA